jgi:hypothetical protein
LKASASYRAFADAGIAEEPAELTGEQLAVVHLPQVDDQWWMRANFELSYVDGWRLTHFPYPDSPDKQIEVHPVAWGPDLKG